MSFASERASDTIIDFCAGAFAIVEKCTYLPQNRIVAVKRLRPDVMKNSEDVKVSEPVATCQCKSDSTCDSTFPLSLPASRSGLDQGDLSDKEAAQQVS